MPLITPRRRFLITAPLALLLPAGLLTYLGLQTVGLVENRHIETINQQVSTIVQGVRNRTRYRLNNEIISTFRSALANHMVDLLPDEPGDSHEDLMVRDPLPFVDNFFIFSKDESLYFFEKTPSDDPIVSHWKLATPTRESFVTRLTSALVTAEENADIYQITQPTNKEFRQLIFPDTYYISETYFLENNQRQLAFYALQRDNSAEDPTFVMPDWMQALGFTIDFDYLNEQFFDSTIKQMYSVEDELRYPVQITDRLTGKVVADISEIGDTNLFQASAIYRPRPFSENFFPWYFISFSETTGRDIMQVARNEKTIYYCLIAAANVCLVAAVFGALRNIAKELALSDMRSNFVARVSHELRTPLGLIRLFAETMELDRIKDEETKKEYLHAITKESERLTHLINNILNFSQIESQKKQYNLTPCSIEDIIFETVDAMQYHFQRHDMNVDMDIESDVPDVNCDHEAIGQALYNILSNAVKYSGDGMSIDVRAFKQNNQVVIEVADQGIGIAKDNQRKIFQEFYRVNDPRVQETGGSGLGLAVVQHIVEGHQGRLTVESNLDEGSTFSIRLPISRQRPHG
ncbi:MAG: ATP-binding protein [Candidatus Hinthialibacter antarcticus]|nr:ATP-binding protein [Candidatus Hinthialibacter antarcticus]